MGCINQPACGGCCYRHLERSEYQKIKEEKVKNILRIGLQFQDYIWDTPAFLPDGTRRRAALAFAFQKKRLLLGFNTENSSAITDCRHCLLLTPQINKQLPKIRTFLEKFCAINNVIKSKKKQISQAPLSGGDLLILEADNGLDLVLEADIELNLNHRMEIFDYVNGEDTIIRFSHRRKNNQEAEPVIEKIKPLLKIGGCDVSVAPGMFLQASKIGEETLTQTVMRYLDNIPGYAADLFCGIGTFSYPLAAAGWNIEAYDVNESLLNDFQASVNRQMLHRVKIFKQNLFKYPLEAEKLSEFDAVIFDPPRAGAAALVQELAKVPHNSNLKKVIAVSCNPHSFVNDANILCQAGFNLERITLVDQFVYSNHSEIVALFTK